MDDSYDEGSGEHSYSKAISVPRRPKILSIFVLSIGISQEV